MVLRCAVGRAKSLDVGCAESDQQLVRAVAAKCLALAK